MADNVFDQKFGLQNVDVTSFFYLLGFLYVYGRRWIREVPKLQRTKYKEVNWHCTYKVEEP